MDILNISPSLLYTSVIITLITGILTYIKVSKYQIWSKQGIKGPAPWPIVGNSLQVLFGKSIIDGLEKRWKKYGAIYGMYQTVVPQLVVGDPDMIKDILVRDWSVFSNRPFGTETGDPITDNFLISLSGNEWKRMRNIITPTFTSGKMRTMFNTMNDCCGLMVQNIRKNITQSATQKIEQDMRHLSGCYSMDVIAKCCFATDTNSFNDPNHLFVTKAKKISDISFLRMLNFLLMTILPARFWLKLKMLPAEVADFFTDVSKSILESRRKQTGVGGAKDYLQLLIEASKIETFENENELKVIDNESHHGYDQNDVIAKEPTFAEIKKRPLSDDEIISNSVLFLVVGYDTTALLITITIYLLTCNQEKQTKLFEEIKCAHEQNNGKFNYELISGLKYLDAVISESLRIFPIAPLMERSTTEDYTFAKNGIKVPKGASVVLPIWNLHRDPKYWKNPDMFEPERFLPENRDKITPYTYIPFGGGPRNCIGMRFALLEAKLAIANLILEFSFNPCSQTDIPLDLTPTKGLLFPKRVIVGIQKREY